MLPPLKARSASANRLDLAAWLTDSANPLPARVAANRVWQHLFGRGIVATVDDFGKQGEKPSHPELLDWLAGEYRGPLRRTRADHLGDIRLERTGQHRRTALRRYADAQNTRRECREERSSRPH